MNTAEFSETFGEVFGPSLRRAGFRPGASSGYADVPRKRVWARLDPAKDSDPWLIAPRYRWVGWSGTFTMDLAIGRYGERLTRLLCTEANESFCRVQAEILEMVPQADRELLSSELRAAHTHGRHEAWLIFVDRHTLQIWCDHVLEWLPDCFLALGASVEDAETLRELLRQ